MRAFKLILQILLGALFIKPFFWFYAKGILRLVVCSDISSATVYSVVASPFLSVFSFCVAEFAFQWFLHRLMLKCRCRMILLLIMFAVLLVLQTHPVVMSIYPLIDPEKRDSRTEIIMPLSQSREIRVKTHSNHAVFKLVAPKRRVRPYEIFDLTDTRGYGRMENDEGCLANVKIVLKDMPRERLLLCLRNYDYERIEIAIDGKKKYVASIEKISKYGEIVINTESEDDANALINDVFCGFECLVWDKAPDLRLTP